MLPATLLIGVLACAPGEQPAEDDLDQAYKAAAESYDVPWDLLMAVSYALTRMDNRGGDVSAHDTIGLMNLRLDYGTPSALQAADALGLNVSSIIFDRVANIQAGAWTLGKLAHERESHTGEHVDTLPEWFPVVAAYVGAEDPMVADGFANQVYDLLQWGFVVETPDGQWLEVFPRDMPWREIDRQATSGSGLSSQFIAASSSNYTDGSRGAADIDTVVIHTIQGSYSGCISWFQNSAASASTHYVMRSSDGEITQMVDEADIGWHAGHWDTNQRSIGIEHEGYVDAPETWYTDAMYRSSAALVRDICDRNSFPCDRDHVIGHYEVPGCSSSSGGGSSCHTDPGSGWDWEYFMSLVSSGESAEEIQTGNLADGAKTGKLEITAYVSRPDETGTCTAAVSGSASGGQLYLTASCVPDDAGHADETGEIRVTMTGSVSNGVTVDGRVAVDGYADSWTGDVESDGGVYAEWTGQHEIGGSVGTVTYSAILKVEP